MAKIFIRITCPFCGSKPFENQVLKATENAQPIVKVWEVKMGGKTKAEPDDTPHTGKGSGGHGVILWTDATDLHPDIKEKWTKWWAEKAIEFAEVNGFIKK